MKKIAIITITDNTNYGNRLQNYAMETFLENLSQDLCVETIWGTESFKRKIKHFIYKLFNFVPKCRRYNKFKKFSENETHILKKEYTEKVMNKFDYIIVGSDQIWNFKWQLSKNEFIVNMPKEKMISYAASFGVNNIEIKDMEKYKKVLNNINYISVREDRGKEIVEKLISRHDISVLIDPTMLINSDEWIKIMKKPNKLKFSNKKYILNYFLGDVSDEIKSKIENIAYKNDCQIIDLLDEKDVLFDSDPYEFLFLEKNAFLICTDSFHSCVFSILFETPFLVFERQDREDKMNSRIDTLLNKFKLENRRFKGNFSEELLKCDYTETKKILKMEQQRSIEFLRKALDIEK